MKMKVKVFIIFPGIMMMLMQVHSTSNSDLNLRPIIGILSQELSSSMENVLEGKNYKSYIAASYVKYFETGGARVVPVLINQNDYYYRKIFNSVNGLVFPSGSISITQSSGYGRAGSVLYGLIKEAAEKGRRVPLFAVNVGLDMLLYLAANNRSARTSCEAKNRADPLDLQPGWSDSQLFRDVPNDVFQTLTNTNATSNFHSYCTSEQKFQELCLLSNYKILSTSKDDKGLEYISTIEHRHLPIYGFQWHPEKNPFEWRYNSIPHNRETIKAVQYFTNLFVDKTRLDHHSFESPQEEMNYLIYNYNPIYVASLYGSSFQQCYFFE